MKLTILFEESQEYSVADYLVVKGVSPYKDPYPYPLTISGDKFTSLKGCPSKIAGDFRCIHVPKITSLEFAPSIIHGNFICFATGMKSLKDIHKHIHSIDGVIDLTQTAYYCEFKSHMLGLLMIKNLRGIETDGISGFDKFLKVAKIINKYLPEGDVFECQEELIAAGFEEYAQV